MSQDTSNELPQASPKQAGTTPSTDYTIPELMEKYKKHAYPGEVEQTIEYLERIVTQERNKASTATMELARIFAKMNGKHDLYDYADHWLVSHEQRPYQPSDIENLAELKKESPHVQQ